MGREKILQIMIIQMQKQLSGGVLKKRCSENMQQIYKRTPIPLQLDWNNTSAWVFSRKFAAYFQNAFP